MKNKQEREIKRWVRRGVKKNLNFIRKIIIIIIDDTVMGCHVLTGEKVCVCVCERAERSGTFWNRHAFHFQVD